MQTYPALLCDSTGQNQEESAHTYTRGQRSSWTFTVTFGVWGRPEAEEGALGRRGEEGTPRVHGRGWDPLLPPGTLELSYLRGAPIPEQPAPAHPPRHSDLWEAVTPSLSHPLVSSAGALPPTLLTASWEDPELPRGPQTHDLPRPDSLICPKAPDAAGRGLLLRRFSPWVPASPPPKAAVPRSRLRAYRANSPRRTFLPGRGRGITVPCASATPPRCRRAGSGACRPRAAAPPPLGPSDLAREFRGRARGSPIDPSPA